MLTAALAQLVSVELARHRHGPAIPTVRAMRVGSRAERDPVNSIEQIRDRQDHLHAMGYAQVNGAPATEIHLAASTVRQAANDLAALLDAAEATRRVVGEAKAHGWVNVSASAMRDLYATSDRLLPQKSSEGEL